MPAAPMALFLKRLLIGAASLGGLHAVAQRNQDKIDLFFMRLFRDLGRYKARKRRQQASNGTGLISMLLRHDDPLQDLFNSQNSSETEDHSDLPTYTLAELFEFGNGFDMDDNDEDEPPTILISIFGLVYDVTKGQKFYGADGSYSHFAGHDITYCLATGSKSDDDCLNQMDYYQDYSYNNKIRQQQAAAQEENDDQAATSSDDDDKEPQPADDASNKDTKTTDSTTPTIPPPLTAQQLDEGKRWLSFFHLHDKYPLVGTLELHETTSDDETNASGSRFVDWDAYLNQLVTKEVVQQQQQKQQQQEEEESFSSRDAKTKRRENDQDNETISLDNNNNDSMRERNVPPILQQATA